MSNYWMGFLSKNEIFEASSIWGNYFVRECYGIRTVSCFLKTQIKKFCGLMFISN